MRRIIDMIYYCFYNQGCLQRCSQNLSGVRIQVAWPRGPRRRGSLFPTQ